MDVFEQYRFVWIVSLIFFGIYFLLFGLAVAKRPFVFDVATGTQVGSSIPVTWSSKHGSDIKFFDQLGYEIGSDRISDLTYGAYGGSASITSDVMETKIVSIVVYNWFGLTASQCLALNYA